MLRRKKRDPEHLGDSTFACYCINLPTTDVFDSGTADVWTDDLLVCVHDQRFTPARGAWFNRRHIVECEGGKHKMVVPVMYHGCCKFGTSDAHYLAVKQLLVTLLTGKMDYQQAFPKSLPITRFLRVSC